jgi:hypothetical protein
MTNEEVRKLLEGRRHLLSGYVLLRICYLGFVVTAAGLVCLKPVFFVSWGWVALSFLLGVISLMAWYNARDRLVMSVLIVEDPMMVYWAHASGEHGPDLEASVENCTTLRLHLRIGRQLDVELPVSKMRELNAWLRERNPQIRWGHYERSDAPPLGERTEGDAA